MEKEILSKQETIEKYHKKINDIRKKYYCKPNENTKKINNKLFILFIAELLTISNIDAREFILETGVIVNNELVKDVNYILSIGDIVQADIGLNIVNSGFMAIVN